MPSLRWPVTRPYDLLASVYDGGWFEYSEYIASLVAELEEERERPFRRVCDAACGTGLLLRLLSGEESVPSPEGRRLAGFDCSAAMLARARERVPEALLAEGDLAGHFPFSGPFDLVTCVYDSLNYLLETERIREFFRAVRGRLFPEGLFLLDFNTALMYERRDGMEQPHLIGGRQFRETLSYEPGPPPLVTTTFIFADGTEVHRQRPREVDEIEELLGETGFRVLDTFDVMDLDQAYDEEAEGDEPSGKVVCSAIPG
ncbi:MAG: class I SAM-dependent methyltransferase [Spirochaetaceae bacterium]|nr:MAG: class I SAM-dependent methyltransferase [Spirochaetaceae bacterium]